MPRPQFTVRASLVAMLVVAAFVGGMAWQRCIDAYRRADPNDPSDDIIVYTARSEAARQRPANLQLIAEPNRNHIRVVFLRNP